MKIMTDSPIRFPGLLGDWEFTMSSKALDIGNGIYWYGILIAAGLLALAFMGFSGMKIW
jgi:phosphatidylglycerol:prolipoprotein diacylglycerol transferase